MPKDYVLGRKNIKTKPEEESFLVDDIVKFIKTHPDIGKNIVKAFANIASRESAQKREERAVEREQKKIDRLQKKVETEEHRKELRRRLQELQQRRKMLKEERKDISSKLKFGRQARKLGLEVL